ncbi:hypothetical protein COOONC_19731, partial [Cooperia oncophora]
LLSGVPECNSDRAQEAVNHDAYCIDFPLDFLSVECLPALYCMVVNFKKRFYDRLLACVSFLMKGFSYALHFHQKREGAGEMHGSVAIISLERINEMLCLSRKTTSRSSYSIVAVTTIWLKSHILMESLLGDLCSGYIIFRCDRKRKKSGGVAL